MAIILPIDRVPAELLELFEPVPIPPRIEQGLNSIFRISPEPYGGDHFAAWPTRLVAPMLKMATSERGCCPTCGAAVVRVVEKVKLKRERPNELTKRTGEDGTGNYCDNTVDGVATRTKGWRPGCNCPGFADQGSAVAKELAVPCRALDPFGGTGTTAGVANALGVDAVICELFPEYAEQARERLRNFAWNPPAATVAKRRKKIDASAHQPALFEVTR